MALLRLRECLKLDLPPAWLLREGTKQLCMAGQERKLGVMNCFHTAFLARRTIAVFLNRGTTW